MSWGGRRPGSGRPKGPLKVQMTICIDPAIRETLRKVAGDITGVAEVIERLVEERYGVHPERFVSKRHMRMKRGWQKKETLADLDYSGTYSDEAYARRREFVRPFVKRNEGQNQPTKTAGQAG